MATVGVSLRARPCVSPLRSGPLRVAWKTSVVGLWLLRPVTVLRTVTVVGDSGMWRLCLVPTCLVGMT